MKKFVFEYQNTSCIAQQEFESFASELVPELGRVTTALTEGYDTDYASINVPRDTDAVERVLALIAEKKELKPTALVLIGIGGSNLGTVAVHEAVQGLFFNEKNASLKFYCADTVDSNKLHDQLFLVERELQQGHNILLNVVTKSGTTTETIANFELFLALLKKYKPHDFHRSVVVTTDQGSSFSKYAVEHNFSCLEIPPRVGGRYSVFTAVGLFPLGFLGIDIKKLVAGAQDAVSRCVDPAVAKNPAAASALLKYILYQQQVTIHDLFVFSTELASVGSWYRQLMGESIGKEFTINRQRVETGITPTVSVGSADLHSVGQLYLAGPRDKYTTFVVVEQPKAAVRLPVMAEFESYVPQIQGRSLSEIMNAIFQGVQIAYRKVERPYGTITLQALDEEQLGQLLQFFMMEMIYLGYLFNVDPFNQPQVELYKKETRTLLARDR